MKVEEVPISISMVQKEIKQNQSQKEYQVQKDEYYCHIIDEEEKLSKNDVEALSYLGDLGFLDFQKNKDVMKACKGDKTLAVSLLLKEQNKDLMKQLV